MQKCMRTFVRPPSQCRCLRWWWQLLLLLLMLASASALAFAGVGHTAVDVHGVVGSACRREMLVDVVTWPMTSSCCASVTKCDMSAKKLLAAHVWLTCSFLQVRTGPDLVRPSGLVH